MFEDFDPKTVLATEKAKALAEQLEDESVATGHLIYGLTVDQSVCLHHIFLDLNVDPDMFSGYVESLPREPEVPNGPWNRHCVTVFERARDAANELNSKIVRPSPNRARLPVTSRNASSSESGSTSSVNCSNTSWICAEMSA